MSENLKEWVDISQTIITIRALVGANNKLEELEALSIQIQIQIYLKKKKNIFVAKRNLNSFFTIEIQFEQVVRFVGVFLKILIWLQLNRMIQPLGFCN